MRTSCSRSSRRPRPAISPTSAPSLICGSASAAKCCPEAAGRHPRLLSAPISLVSSVQAGAPDGPLPGISGCVQDTSAPAQVRLSLPLITDRDWDMPDSVQEVLQAFARGELVVVTDDDDREGEGDLIVAASLCTAEKMAIIIRHTSGIVCAPITAEDARRLRLDPMVAHNESNHTTAFTVSIDYKPDGGTGISADERASCCRALASPNAGAADFARPGHVFPLLARAGGVLLRSGHTEAAVELCKLASLPRVGVISDLMNDDGT